jgi:hypothetical protein
MSANLKRLEARALAAFPELQSNTTLVSAKDGKPKTFVLCAEGLRLDTAVLQSLYTETATAVWLFPQVKATFHSPV